MGKQLVNYLFSGSVKKAILALTVTAMVLAFSQKPAAWAITVTDVFDRQVEVPDKVERVIALGGSMMFLTYLGAVDMAVGVEEIEKTVISKPYIMVNAQKIKDKPIVGSGGSMRLYNVEEIILLKPDVVFILATNRGEVDDLQRQINKKVIGLSIQGEDGEYDEAIFLRSILTIGQAMGMEGRAQKLADYVANLKNELSYDPGPGQRAKAYVGGLSSRGNRDLMSTTAKSMPMALAKIDNLMAGAAPGAAFISKEHLLAINPPLLFIDANGLELIREAISKDPLFYQRLTALVDSNAFLTLPHNSYLFNVETQYANAFYMAKMAYPAGYPDLDPAAKADEIYTAFYGQKLFGRLKAEFGGFARLRLKGTELVIEN
ncbi:MAG: ABC transporter substrate-binding protein [Deltaproteobacteria bacterium]|jgi:iron complex transport system substrate-binding protein|nr:ABC transporter substrate-binding protein [Deltaproteobacteria bacterium]